MYSFIKRFLYFFALFQTELTKLKAAVAEVDSDVAIEIARKIQAENARQHNK